MAILNICRLIDLAGFAVQTFYLLLQTFAIESSGNRVVQGSAPTMSQGPAGSWRWTRPTPRYVIFHSCADSFLIRSETKHRGAFLCHK